MGQGGAVDLAIMALLTQLTNAQVQQINYYQQRRDGDREARFKIHRTIPKITADKPMTLIDEFDDFETVRANTTLGREGLGGHA